MNLDNQVLVVYPELLVLKVNVVKEVCVVLPALPVPLENEALPVSLVFQDPTDLSALRVLPEIEVFKVLKAKRVVPEILALLACPDFKAYVAYPVALVLTAEMVLLASVVFQEPMENLVSKAHKVFKVYQVRWVFPVIRVFLENPVKLANLELLDLLVHAVIMEKMDYPVLRDLQVQQVKTEQEVKPVLPVQEVSKAYQVHPAVLVPLVKMVLMVLLDLKVRLDPQD